MTYTASMPRRCALGGEPRHVSDCCLCHGWGQFDCMCDEPDPHFHECGQCAAGERFAVLNRAYREQRKQLRARIDDKTGRT